VTLRRRRIRRFAHQTTSNSMLLMLSSWPRIPPQFCTIKGLDERREWKCKARASNSLPSRFPSIRIGRSVRAARGRDRRVRTLPRSHKRGVRNASFALHLGIRPAMQKMRILADLSSRTRRRCAARARASPMPVDDEAGLFGQQRLGEILIAAVRGARRSV